MLFKKVRLFLRIIYTKNGQVTVKTSALDHAAWSSLGKEYIESDSVHSGDDGKGLHVHFPARPTSVRRGCWKLSKLRGERGRDVFLCDDTRFRSSQQLAASRGCQYQDDPEGRNPARHRKLDARGKNKYGELFTNTVALF